MKKLISIVSLILILLYSCDSKSTNEDAGTDNMPVVGERVELDGGQSLMRVKFKDLTDTVPFNLDNLLEKVEFVQLESSDKDAMIGDGWVVIGESYMVAYTSGGVKLFEKNGKYVGNVGRKGEGPDEYPFPAYDVALDEKNGRIYILGMGNVDFIPVYNLKGEFVQRIPLAYTVHKGRLEVEDSKILIISMKWNHEENPAIWVQDSEGNLISTFATEATTIQPDFSNEIFFSSISETGLKSFGLSLFGNFQDSIYSLSNDGTVAPEFTIDYGDMRKSPLHNYTAFPGHYIAIIFGDPVFNPMGYFEYPVSTIIIDKETGKGSYVSPYFGSLGGLKFNGRIYGSKDYFVYSVDPGDLADQIEMTISGNPEMSADNATKLKTLLASIDPDGNNVIIYGKIK